MRAGLRRACRLPAIFVLIALSMGAALTEAPAVEAGAASTSVRDYELGSIADHLFDRDGRLSIEDVASRSTSATFVPAGGRPANYGAPSNARSVLWLRIAIPELPPTGENDWTLSLKEVRVRTLELFVPDGAGWRRLVWDSVGDDNSPSIAIRYPVISVAQKELTGKTVYLRMSSRSSLRATVRLQGDLTFASSYGADNFLFGISSGILTMLVLYLLANGLATSDRTILLLSAFAATYLIYILSHQAFLETHIIHGSLFASRILSILASNLIFGWWLLFCDSYLRVGEHRQLLSKMVRVAAGFCILFAIVAALGVFIDARILRLLTPVVGISSLVLGVIVALTMMRYEARRVLLFLLCWSLGLAAGVLRMAHDIIPALGANPYALNATYLATCLCFVIFGIVTSVEIQQRERGLRIALEATTDRLRDFARSASDSFWESDRGGEVTFATGPAAALSGLRAGVTLNDVLLAGGIDPPNSVGNEEYEPQPLRHLLSFRGNVDGETNYIELRGAPRTDADGTFLGYRGVASDTTADVLERRRQVQQQRLAAVGQLAGGVAHEINNLLHPIINLTKRTAEQLDRSDEKRHWLDVVVDSGRRAAEIVAALLTSVRSKDAVAATAPLAEGIRRALDTVRSVVPHGVTLELRESEIAGPVLSVHEVFQVVANLVANAVFATKGGGRIAVEISRPHAPGSEQFAVCLTVVDDGEGMGEDVLRRALDPFFTTRHGSGGTGLGLYVVHEVVRKWGALLDIQSALGEGTRVAIYFEDERERQ